MIRPAVLADIPRLIELGRMFHEESLYGNFGVQFDEEKTAAYCAACIADNDKILVVAVDDGNVVGMASALVAPSFMSMDTIGIETFWWMHPDHRGARDAIGMMLSLEKWAEAEGCKAFVMVVLASIEESPAEQIYRRLGYVPAERSWIKKL